MKNAAIVTRLKTLKRCLVATLLTISTLPLGNAQTSVIFPLTSMFGGHYAGTMTVTSQNPLTEDSNSFYLGTYENVPVSGGTNPVVPLWPNQYAVTWSGVRQTMRITVPASTNVLNALNLTTNVPVFLFTQPNILGIATNINNASGTNVALAGIFSGNGAGLTNVPAAANLGAGVSIALTTNAGKTVISAPLAVTNTQSTVTFNNINGGGGAITIGGVGDTIVIDGSENGVPWTLGAGGTVYDGSCVTIGFDAETLGTTAVAVGALAVAAYDAVAVGDAASAPQQDDVAVGSYATVASTAKQSVAIGTETTATQPYSIVIGAQNFGYKTLLGGTLQVGGAPQPPLYQLTNAELSVQAVTGSVTNTLQIQSTNGAVIMSVNSNNVVAFNAAALTNLPAAALTGTIAGPVNGTGLTNLNLNGATAINGNVIAIPVNGASYQGGTNGLAMTFSATNISFGGAGNFNNGVVVTAGVATNNPNPVAFGIADGSGRFAGPLMVQGGVFGSGAGLTGLPTNSFITLAMANTSSTNAARDSTNTLAAPALTGNIPNGVMAGSYSGIVGNVNNSIISALGSSNNYNGSFAGNAGGVSNVPAASLTGTVPNATLAGTVVVQTSDIHIPNTSLTAGPSILYFSFSGDANAAYGAESMPTNCGFLGLTNFIMCINDQFAALGVGTNLPWGWSTNGVSCGPAFTLTMVGTSSLQTFRQWSTGTNWQPAVAGVTNYGFWCSNFTAGSLVNNQRFSGSVQKLFLHP